MLGRLFAFQLFVFVRMAPELGLDDLARSEITLFSLG